VTFLAFSPIAAYALLAGVALVILLLHLLRPPPRRVVVPSLVLWARVIRDRKRPDARRLLSLLLALGAGLSLTLALTHPEIGALGTSAHRLALVLDNSPSMVARMSDGRSRWEYAIEQARAVLEQSSAATEVRLLDTVGRIGQHGFVERDAAIEALAQVPLPAWGNARMPTASLLAGTQVHLFTDGVAQVDAPERAIVHSAFEPADIVNEVMSFGSPTPIDVSVKSAHVRYGKQSAQFGIESLAPLRGQLPPRAVRLVAEWAGLHQSELSDNWDLASQRKPLNPIEPLQ
jgi:hypothetical protein